MIARHLNFMQFKRIQLKPVYLLTGLLTIAMPILAYFQYQAYQEKKALEARKAFIENFVRQARELAEENRKHPFILPEDPLAPADDPLGRTPPSDAEEMANIKLWAQASPEQRKKLMPLPEQPAMHEPAQTHPDLPDVVQSGVMQVPSGGHVSSGGGTPPARFTGSSALEASPDDSEPSLVELQAVKEMQKKALELAAEKKAMQAK